MDFISKNMNRLAEKGPRLIPVERYVPAGELRELRGVPSLVIGEIAGRDSIAAILALVERGVLNILPTVVYTGTEYGDWRQLEDNIAFLSRKADERGAAVHSPVLVGDPELWSAMAGRHAGELSEKYGPCGFCAACHMYMHISRVPIALAVGARSIVSGERESHEGRVKINQTPEALDAYLEVLAAAGLSLALPLRTIEKNGDIERLVGDDWKEGERQLRCVLSRNYERADGSIACDRRLFRRYLDEFLVPVGKRVVDAMLAGEEDYASIAKDRLTALGSR